jgi:uncharacterized membrane protein
MVLSTDLVIIRTNFLILQNLFRPSRFSLLGHSIIGPLADKWGPLMVAQWLRYCATNRKVAGSIPDGVIGIFH